MKTFAELVERVEQVSHAHPDIRNVILRDGSRWYVRLRYGVVRLARDDRDDPDYVSVTMSRLLGSPSEGVFEDREEFELAFMALADRHPGMHSALHETSERLPELIGAAVRARDLLRDEIEFANASRGRMIQVREALDRALAEYGE